jgi:Mce-associated membrane protein
MAEHADASPEELSETDQTKTSPASPGQTAVDSSESSNGVVSKDTHAAVAASASEAAAEAQAENAEDYDAATDDDLDASDDVAPVNKPMSPVRLAAILGLAIVIALGALVGWLGFRAYQAREAQQQRNLFVQVGRQGAVNLTTIDWQHADADIQRILDSSTGTFYDDFANRSKPFVEVVKKAQSKSVGTVTEAGLESQSGDEAQVLVAVSVKTSNLGTDEEEPRRWRMRMTVQKLGTEAKVSNVAFVP